MSLLIISDLHIWSPADPLYASLLALLRERAAPGDTVVLAGDIFDSFVGNKKVYVQKYSQFLEELQRAGDRGVHLRYIEGNHDFLLQGAFRSISGMKVYTQEFDLELGGKRFFFSHGDTVDRKDYGYLLLRALFRSLVMKLWVMLMPGKWLEKIGESWSQSSRTHKPLLPSDLPLDRRERLRKVYRSYAAERMLEGYDFVVMGHCHDNDEMFFKIGSRQGQYMNVGYPRVHGSFLCWSLGEEKIQREKLPELN